MEVFGTGITASPYFMSGPPTEALNLFSFIQSGITARVGAQE
jgi:hypothetical protein